MEISSSDVVSIIYTSLTYSNGHYNQEKEFHFNSYHIYKLIWVSKNLNKKTNHRKIIRNQNRILHFWNGDKFSKLILKEI